VTIGRLALLAGLFVAPVALLWIGHRYRTMSRGGQLSFWGGVVGYLVALPAVLVVMMLPPVSWYGVDAARELAVHWGLLLGAAVGLAVGRVVGDRPGTERGGGEP
jgi:hypothetical protein